MLKRSYPLSNWICSKVLKMKIILTWVGKGFGRSYLEYLIKKYDYEIIGLTRDLNDFSKNFLKTIKY